MKFPRNIKALRLYLLTGLAFWLLRLMWFDHNYRSTFTERTINDGWRMLPIVVLHYILFEYTFNYISKKRIFGSIALIVGHIFIYSWGMYFWRELGINLGIYTPLVVFKSLEAAVSDQMSYSMMTFFFFGVVRHRYNYYKLKRDAKQLRVEKQAAELNYLKAQTHPHFLFNTLNNIYSLAKDKSDLAPESILRLSKILRFMLYETTGDFISVEQELQIIADYIELEKLRYDETLRINFNHNVENIKQAIPPLLLIPLVENAFKHGVSETRSQPFVDIHLSVNNRQLVYIVKNSSEDSSEDETIKENIGLSNLRRQLELLYTDYDLSVKPGKGIFTSTLRINLASHV